MNYKASVIISFYNKIEWLELLLAALERQTLKEFEVIIADDGSKEEVVERIKELKVTLPLSIQHVWHPDKGFMKTSMLNKAIVASQSEYLIFIDGDCIPHKDFVKDHVRMQNPDQVLAGRRVNLSDRISKSLAANNIRNGKLESFFFIRLLIDGIFNKSRDVEKGISFKTEFINRKLGTYNKGLLGCNFSVAKKALLEVNGFDERYHHPGVGEDSEIEFRLKKNGLKIFSPKFCIVQYHLWHPRLSRKQEAANMELYNEMQAKGYVYTPYGINKIGS